MSKRRIAYARKNIIDPEEEGEVLPFEPREIIVHTDYWFDRDYELHDEVLGRGKFGEVRRCSEISTNLTLAAKIVSTRKPKDKEDVRKEIKIMSQLRHPKILQIYDAFESAKRMCIITEIIEGGELFDRVVDEQFDLTERVAILFMRQIIDGLAFIHSQNFIHLDMKPENIICVAKTGTRIKIIDFGLAMRYDSFSSARVMAGTVDFMAPEVCSFEDVTPATDMWSVGVICYVLVSGLSPFCGDDDSETICNIQRVEFDFAAEEFDEITAGCKDFIKKLLIKDPRKRMSAEESLKHSWLNKITRSQTNKHLSKKHHIRFFVRRKWKKVIRAVIALNRFSRLIRQRREGSQTHNIAPVPEVQSLSEDNCEKSDWRTRMEENINEGLGRTKGTAPQIKARSGTDKWPGSASGLLTSSMSCSSGYESSGSAKSTVTLDDTALPPYATKKTDENIDIDDVRVFERMESVETIVNVETNDSGLTKTPNNKQQPEPLAAADSKLLTRVLPDGLDDEIEDVSSTAEIDINKLPTEQCNVKLYDGPESDIVGNTPDDEIVRNIETSIENGEQHVNLQLDEVSKALSNSDDSLSAEKQSYCSTDTLDNLVSTITSSSQDSAHSSASSTTATLDSVSCDSTPQRVEPEVIEPKAMGEVEPKAMGEVEPKAMREVEPNAMGEVEHKAMGEVEPKAMREMEPKAMENIEQSGTGVIEPSDLGVSQSRKSSYTKREVKALLAHHSSRSSTASDSRRSSYASLNDFYDPNLVNPSAETYGSDYLGRHNSRTHSGDRKPPTARDESPGTGDKSKPPARGDKSTYGGCRRRSSIAGDRIEMSDTVNSHHQSASSFKRGPSPAPRVRRSSRSRNNSREPSINQDSEDMTPVGTTHHWSPSPVERRAHHWSPSPTAGSPDERRKMRIAVICNEQHSPSSSFDSYSDSTERIIPIEIERSPPPRHEFGVRRFSNDSGSLSDFQSMQYSPDVLPTRNRMNNSPIRGDFDEDTYSLRRVRNSPSRDPALTLNRMRESPIRSGMEGRRARIAAIMAGSTESLEQTDSPLSRMGVESRRARITPTRSYSQDPISNERAEDSLTRTSAAGSNRPSSRTNSEDARHQRIAAIMAKSKS